MTSQVNRSLKNRILSEMLVKKIKGCLCSDGKHNKTWHCLVANPDISTFYADFPFNRPPTKGTGLWQRKEFHRIKGWGLKRRN